MPRGTGKNEDVAAWLYPGSKFALLLGPGAGAKFGVQNLLCTPIFSRLLGHIY